LIAVASRSFSRHPILRREILDRYGKVTFNESGRVLAGDELIAFLRGHERAVIALERVDDPLLARLPELSVIAKYGVGLDGLDLRAMARRGVRLGWTGGVNRRDVAELVIGFAIALLRHIPAVGRSLQDGEWRQVVGRRLSERTVGLIGCGHVGKDVGELLRGLGCRVLAYDVRRFPEFYARTGVVESDLETVLRTSDIVSLHVPFDESTANILNAKRLSWMKPSALLINAARGGLVDEVAIKDALRQNRLAGAAFDVFAAEPPADLDLLRLPNVIVTPHIGGTTEEGILAMGRAAIRGLESSAVPTEDLWTPARP